MLNSIFMRVLLLLLSTYPLIACDDDGNGLGQSTTARYEVKPDNFTFYQQLPNTQDARLVEIKNVGLGELRIPEIKLSLQESLDGEFELFYFMGSTTDINENFVPFTFSQGNEGDASIENNLIVLENEESITLKAIYKPKDEILDAGGIVTIKTNVESGPILSIPIKISDNGPQIVVDPTSLDFDRVAANVAQTREITVFNYGQAPLYISEISINGSLDFTPLINGKDPRLEPAVLQDPDGDGTPGLLPATTDGQMNNNQFTITVEYKTPLEGPDRGELIISSNDSNNPNLVVDLVGNAKTPCLRVTPTAIEFRASLVNRVDSQAFLIESCGGAGLKITDIYVENDGEGTISLPMENFPMMPLELPAVADGSFDYPSRQIEVAFAPREQKIYNGKLVIKSNDPAGDPIEGDTEFTKKTVSVLGRGSENICPQAKAINDEFYVLPLETVVLDGSPSVDQDGPNNLPIEYEWVITSRPDGSVSQVVESFFMVQQPSSGGPSDDLSTPTAFFFVDVPGLYIAELRVKDQFGLDSIACDNPAVVTIVAEPQEAIQVQLLWQLVEEQTGGMMAGAMAGESAGAMAGESAGAMAGESAGSMNQAPMEVRQGADLDLHFRHPNAPGWFTSPYDCYFANPVPDWGQIENPQDDPFLDLDDINGGGPENLSLRSPEDGGVYQIGVHYYSNIDRLTGFAYGPVRATVRIFCSGSLAWDYTLDGDPGYKDILAKDHFWTVASVSWPECNVVKIDQYSETAPRP